MKLVPDALSYHWTCNFTLYDVILGLDSNDTTVGIMLRLTRETPYQQPQEDIVPK